MRASLGREAFERGFEKKLFSLAKLLKINKKVYIQG